MCGCTASIDGGTVVGKLRLSSLEKENLVCLMST